MADREAIYHQASFLGGEWSPLAQGRDDNPAYKTALNICLNAIPVEEGAWVRRSGTQFLGPPKGRGTAKLLPFVSNATDHYVMVFTDGDLQFFAGTGPVCTNDRRTVTASSSASGVLSLTVDAAHGWSVGDFVLLWFPTTVTPAQGGPYRNRFLRIETTPAANELTLKDDIGNALPFDGDADDLIDVVVCRLKIFSTSWTSAMLPGLRAVQEQTRAIVLSGDVFPQVVEITTEADGDTDPVFANLAAATFQDGPYLDRQETSPGVAETGTVDAYSGSITFTPASTVPVAADVGRHIRLWSEPAAWASGTTYTSGQYVTHDNEWWVFTYSSGLAGVIPGTNTTVNGATVMPWSPVPDAGRWAWGTITAQDGTDYTVSLSTALNSANGTTISEWQLGLYMAGQYPTCGVYHEGRLWLAGAVPNRVDACAPNPVDGVYIFSPTDINGIVTDDSAISATLNFDEVQQIYWMLPDAQGILVGTAGGEILISASQNNDPITPSSRQAAKTTRYLCANIEPQRAGMAVVFVQRYGRRLMEYLPDSFTGRFTGRHLNEFSKHLSTEGIAEIAYQQETAPVVWARDNDNALTGHTYRRVSRFITEAPAFAAAHRHQIADNDVTVVSLCVVPGGDGLSDMLYLVTKNDSDAHAVEVMRPLFKEV